jgi:hypothetical protein
VINVWSLSLKPCYLSRIDHDGKIRSRKQRTDIRKYSFVNRTIQLWNQLLADAIRTVSCKPSNFRKRVRKVINEVKCRCGEGEMSVHQSVKIRNGTVLV